MAKKIKQTVIPQNIVTMAKFIQECDKKKVPFVIVQKRQIGKTEAFRIARNNN
jgi:hypothetical protein